MIKKLFLKKKKILILSLALILIVGGFCIYSHFQNKNIGGCFGSDAQADTECMTATLSCATSNSGVAGVGGDGPITINTIKPVANLSWQPFTQEDLTSIKGAGYTLVSAGYTILKGTDSNSLTALVSSIVATSYSWSHPLANTTYYWKVRVTYSYTGGDAVYSNYGIGYGDAQTTIDSFTTPPCRCDNNATCSTTIPTGKCSAGSCTYADAYATDYIHPPVGDSCNNFCNGLGGGCTGAYFYASPFSDCIDTEFGQLCFNCSSINYWSDYFYCKCLISAVSGYCITDCPTLTLSAYPVSIYTGQSSVLTWSSTNATACTASASPANTQWTGSKILSGNQTITNITATTAFSMTCTGPRGSVTKSATVTVSLAPPAPPTLTLSANPTSIKSGEQSVLTWTSANATSCTASASPSNTQWTGSKAVTGDQTVTNITATTVFSMTCTGAGGEITESATVNLGKSYWWQEIIPW